MAANHVLLVEDQIELRRLFRSALESMDRRIQVVDVPSGEEALLVFSRQAVDLAVLDVRLVGISGLELMKKLKRSRPSVKVILITGMTDVKIREEILHSEADAFFFKPVEMEGFLSQVAQYLEVEYTGAGTQTTVKTGDAPQQEDGPGSHLQEYLSVMVDRLGTGQAVIFDEIGIVLAQVGKPILELEASWLLSLHESLRASRDISQALGAQPPVDLHCIYGREFDLYAAHAGLNGSVLLAAAPAERENMLPKVAAEFAALRRFLEGPGAPRQDLEVSEPEPAVEEDFQGAEGDLDDIFGQAESFQIDSKQVDAFWDTAIQQSGESPATRDGMLSYEQARRLGLAPDE